MGEISDALRRARLERENRPQGSEEPELRTPVTVAARLNAAATAPTPAHDRPAAPEARVDRTHSGSWPSRAVVVEGQRAVAERFRQLAVRVEQKLAARNARLLLVSSAQRGDGKTLTSCNLALALASLEADRRVALVDLDLRKPSIAQALGVEVPCGVEAVLRDGRDPGDARITTDVASLDLYATGRSDRNAHSLLSTTNFERLLRHLEGEYSTIIIDTPPILLVPDVPLIASRVGACLLVARAGATRRASLQEALRAVPADTVIGIFLNDERAGARRLHYYQDYYAAEADEDASVES